MCHALIGGLDVVVVKMYTKIKFNFFVFACVFCVYRLLVACERKRVFLYVRVETEIGKGRYGVVYKGYIVEGSENDTIDTTGSEDSGFAQGFSSSKLAVAVKTIKSSSIDSFYLSSLAGEIDILSKLGKHPNVVSMLGACTENKSTMNKDYMNDENGLLLIMELCEHKSLEKFLRVYKQHFLKDNVKQSRLKAEGYSFEEANFEDGFEFGERLLDQLNVRLLVEWSRQIASGMEHISESKILHLDLAARNVLLDKNLTAKISDFGLSKVLEDSSNYYTRSPGKGLPVFTTPPEALKSYEFSKKTDVWAFGVCMWEIFSFGEVPYAETCELSTENDLNLNYFKFKLDSGYRLPKPEMSSPEIYQLMKECWNKDPKDRPDFCELKNILEMYENISET